LIKMMAPSGKGHRLGRIKRKGKMAVKTAFSFYFWFFYRIIEKRKNPEDWQRGGAMKRKTYVKMMEHWEETPARRRAMVWICRLCPYAVIALYGAVMLYLIFQDPMKLIFYLSVPALVLVAVSVMRAKLDWPRPFEELAFEPLTGHGKGKSFPSRHTASAFIIGMACLYVNWWLGALALFLALGVGATRVLAGLHYPRDILAGMVISIGIGYVCFFLLAPLFHL